MCTVHPQIEAALTVQMQEAGDCGTGWMVGQHAGVDAELVRHAVA